MKRKHIFILLSVFAMLLALIGCGKKEEPEPVIEEPIEDVVEEPVEVEPDFGEGRSKTTGELLKHSNGKLFGVMIENSPNSRPHTGLTSADIVYEMEVEYNVTRFFAIFNDETPEKVGPVRSSRHYYLPFTESWGAPYIHFGASKFAAKDLEKLEVESFDGTKKGHKLFERDTSRKAPHNAYLITERLPMKEFSKPSENPHFGFTDEIDGDGNQVTKLDITYYSGNVTNYEYNEKTKTYDRSIRNEAHKDRESGERVTAKNLFILYAEHEDLNTSSKHININFDKEGDLSYYVEGKKLLGKWKNEKGNIKFYYENGEEIDVLPGKTWIQVVDQEKKSNVVEG